MTARKTTKARKTVKTDTRPAQPKVHRHIELFTKVEGLIGSSDDMCMLVKDSHIEIIPNSGNADDGFVFMSNRSVNTCIRWRGILSAMLRLVDEAQKIIEDEEK